MNLAVLYFIGVIVRFANIAMIFMVSQNYKENCTQICLKKYKKNTEFVSLKSHEKQRIAKIRLRQMLK